MRTFEIYQFTNMHYSINYSHYVYIISHWLNLYLKFSPVDSWAYLLMGCVSFYTACINSDSGIRLDTATLTVMSHCTFVLLFITTTSTRHPALQRQDITERNREGWYHTEPVNYKQAVRTVLDRCQASPSPLKETVLHCPGALWKL